MQYLSRSNLTGVIILMLLVPLFGQQRTVGLFQNSEASFNGYTLFSPIASRTTYLIDNCGYKVHSWESAYRPGLSVYMDSDGSIVRTGVIQSQFLGAGAGGRIERINWEGQLDWAYEYSSEVFHQHHDIELLPNGNIMLIAWEYLSREDAIALGRQPDQIANRLWPDHIVELAPQGENMAEIVWEWHVIDHIVQDIDSMKPNFAVISEHPELVDINYLGPGDFPSGADWNHTNGVDYWPEEDLVLLSVRAFSEIWVIDHSTTTAEAALHSGGRYGKGGDLLYRWGNPEAYGRGNAGDQQLFGQHDATWVTEGPNKGDILVYNNGINRPGGNASSIDRIKPPFLSGTGFEIDSEIPFGPLEAEWTYMNEVSPFYSPALSGAHLLPNGNILVCVGGAGFIFEITSQGEIVWQYINPDAAGAPVAQGEPAGANNVFKVSRYGTDHPAFEGKVLQQIDPIELDPLPDECELFPEDTVSGNTNIAYVHAGIFKLLQNPAVQTIPVEVTANGMVDLSVSDVSGMIVFSLTRLPAGRHEIDLTGQAPGIYFLTALDVQKGIFQTEKVVLR